MPTPVELLEQSLSALRNAARFSGNKNSYRKDNPNEYAQVIAYLDGGVRPNATSEMGKHAVLQEDALRALAPVPPPDGLGLKLSAQNDRSNPVDLDGKTIEGTAFVFVDQADSVTVPVKFYLDEDPDDTPLTVENNPPFDLLGGTSAAANPWHTDTVEDGLHLIRVKDATGKYGEASFTVDNGEPPPEPPPGGDVLYRLNWEYANNDGFDPNVWGKQCDNIAPEPIASRGTVSKTNSPVCRGQYAGKYTLPPNDAAHNRSACEMLHRRDLDYGTHDFFSIAYYFPADWQEPSSFHWGCNLLQPNYQGIKGAAVNLMAHSDHIGLVVESGYYNESTGHMQYRTGNGAATGPLGWYYAVPRDKFVKETWLEIILHVYWTLDTAQGVFETWFRKKGDVGWLKTAELRNIATVQWKDGYDPTDPSHWTNDKLGAYRGAATFPLTVYNDCFSRCTSFAAAETAFA